MATITDFEGWLDQAGPETTEETYALYQCVAEEEDYGIYRCQKGKDGKLFVKCATGEDTLMLASDKAKQSFLSLVTKKYCNDVDIESWYGFRRAMEKDD